MKPKVTALLAAMVLACAGPALAQSSSQPPAQARGVTTDHSKLKPLMRDFASGPGSVAQIL
ncbi:hypothetical protein ACDP63_23495 [Paracoccus sp. P2]|uniref:hypothetical protein n=1 Tax=Paracoccus sp. P2 TaxID=3248840 RepID=UPI00391F4E46